MSPAIFSGPNRQWWTLAAVAFGLFMIMLDNTVVNVALPAIQQDLGIGLSELQWIVAGYALTFASLLLVGGKLGDAYGRRLIFVLGMGAFTLASLWCGLAGSGSELILARVAQGVGAAMMSPASLSIISATFPPARRGAAIGIWAGVSALALAIGPLVGGLLTEHLSWHWIFFVNIPVGVIGIAAAFLMIDESRDETHERLDIPGLVTSALGLFALTYGLIEGNTYGWGSARILGAFLVAAVALVGFLLLERHQRAPMLPLELFSNRTFVGANLVTGLVALAMFGVFFFISLYMQGILGYSAVQTGAAFLPMTLLIVVTAPIAGRLSDRLGSRWLMTGGLLLVSAHLLLLARLDENATYAALLVAFVVGGVGMACTMTPSAAAATRAVPVDKAGVGSAVLNTFRQVGGTLGIAVMGAIMAHEIDGRRTPTAFVEALQTTLVVAAGIAFSGAVLAAWLVRTHRTSAAAAPADAGA